MENRIGKNRNENVAIFIENIPTSKGSFFQNVEIIITPRDVSEDELKLWSEFTIKPSKDDAYNRMLNHQLECSTCQLHPCVCPYLFHSHEMTGLGLFQDSMN